MIVPRPVVTPVASLVEKSLSPDSNCGDGDCNRATSAERRQAISGDEGRDRSQRSLGVERS
jgi:hypothetical protein